MRPPTWTRETLALWLLLVALPVMLGHAILQHIVNTDERSRREALLLKTEAELRVFAADLRGRSVLLTALTEVNRELGLAGESCASSPTVASAGESLLRTLVPAMWRHCPIKPVLVLVFDPSGTPTASWADRRCPFVRRAEDRHRLRRLCQTFIGHFYNPEVPFDVNEARRVRSGLREVLGLGANVERARREVVQFTSHFTSHTGYMSLQVLPPLGSSGSTWRAGFYVVLFDEAKIDIGALVRQACRAGQSEMERRVGWGRGPDLQISEGRNGAGVRWSMPSGEALRVLRQRAGDRPGRPFLEVRARAGVGRSPWRDVAVAYDIAVVFLFVPLFVGVQAVVRQPRFLAMSVRERLTLGFATVMLPVLGGLLVIPLGWFAGRTREFPRQTAAILDQTVQAADWRLWQVFENEQLRRDEKAQRLRALLGRPAGEIRAALRAGFASASVSMVGLFDMHGTEIVEAVDGRPVGADLQHLAFLIAAAALEREKTKGSERLSKQMLISAVADSVLDVRGPTRLLKDSGTLQRAPFGSKQMNVFATFLRDPQTGRVLGLVILIGDYKFRDRPLGRIIQAAWRIPHWDGTLPTSLMFYHYPWRLKRELASIRHCMPQDESAWVDLLPVAQRAQAALSVATREDREGDANRWAFARPLQADQFIGLAVASDRRRGLRAEMGLFVVMMGLLALAFAGTVAITSWVLAWPIGVFREAMRLSAEGEFAWRIALPQRDEFGTLTAVFNGMAERLVERRRLARFVSDDVVTALERGAATELQPGGALVETTVLVSDIRGFTTMSETHAAESIVAMLNDYFTAMESAIRAEGGSLVSYIGDAIVAHFPPQDGGTMGAVRAARAALAMRAGVRALNLERAQRGEFPIDNGIGLATGVVVSGLVGSDTGRLAHVLIGDTPERAATLESLTRKEAGSGIAIDAPTRAQLSEAFHIRAIRPDVFELVSGVTCPAREFRGQ